MIDISILFEKPSLKKEALLYIEPLAPLSMVASMPGSFYKTLSEPSSYMIYGMLENLMGWHFSDEIRKEILKNIGKHWKKKFQIHKIIASTSEVGFLPLLQNYISIESPVFLKPHVEYYDDYWTQHLKDSDRRHLGGARNYSWKIESELSSYRVEFREESDNLKSELVKDPKNEVVKKSISDLKKKYEEKQTTVFKENKDRFPKYYSSPKKREFIITHGKFGYKIKTSYQILEILINAINNNHAPTHLGTNEGWVDVSIKEL